MVSKNRRSVASTYSRSFISFSMCCVLFDVPTKNAAGSSFGYNGFARSDMELAGEAVWVHSALVTVWTKQSDSFG